MNLIAFAPLALLIVWAVYAWRPILQSPDYGYIQLYTVFSMALTMAAIIVLIAF